MKVLSAALIATTILVSSTLASVSRPSPAQSIYGSVSPPGPSGPWILTGQEDRAHRRPSRPASTQSSIPSALSPPIDYGGDPRIWFRPQGEAGEWVYIGEGVTRWEAGELQRNGISRLIFCDFNGVERVTTIQVAGPPDDRNRPSTVREDLSSVRGSVTHHRMIYDSEVAHGRTPVDSGFGGPRCDFENPRPLDPISPPSSFGDSLLTFFGLASPPSPSAIPLAAAPIAVNLPHSFGWVGIGNGVLRWEDSDAPIPAVRMVGGSVRSEVLLRFKDSTGKWRVIKPSYGGGPPGHLSPVTTEDDLKQVQYWHAREKFFKDQNIALTPSGNEVLGFDQDRIYSPSSVESPVTTESTKVTSPDWQRLPHVHKNIANRLHSALQRMTTEEAYIVAFIFGVGLGSLLSMLFKIARQLLVRHRACAARRAARASSSLESPLTSRSVFEYPGHQRSKEDSPSSAKATTSYDLLSSEEKL
ncbi:hypothetical protein BDY24DRAFT_402710 [Mrakia frigida]|uniref:uncharacterized protein n=1 Tax=Mrakia frigida TaxID=29902 RepID=UPI003FCC0104